MTNVKDFRLWQRKKEEVDQKVLPINH
jgi:hypothetical protein